MKKLVIIDGNNNLYRAYFANTNLTFNGTNIGAIFQFPRIIASLKKTYNPNKIIITWDGKSSSHRRKLLPTYRVRDKKTNLRFDIEDFLYQEKHIKWMMTALGIPQIHNINMEADDYIYYLTKRYEKKGWKIIIVSTDKDFNQLISPKCSIHSEKLKKIIHHKNAKKVLGYEPHQTVDYLCILGDDSDKIPGYHGMGEVKTKDFLAKFGSINEYLSSKGKYGRLDNQKLKEIYLFNRKLIDLEYYHENYLKRVDITYIEDRKNPKPDIKKFTKLCLKFGIRELRKPEFINLFKPQHEEEL